MGVSIGLADSTGPHYDCTGANLTFCGPGPAFVDGMTYCLQADIVPVPFECWDVTASDVVIDCYGWSIQGADLGNQAAIHITGDNVTVYDCELHDYPNGVTANGTVIDPSNDINISYNEIHGSTGTGIRFGLAGANVDGDIQNNVIYDMGGDGIYLQQSTPVNIIDNLVHDITDDGIELHSSTNNDITDNEIYDCGSDGIAITQLSNGNDVHSNSVYRNTAYALRIDTADTSTIRYNDFNASAGGIYLTNSDTNVIIDCEATDNVVAIESDDGAGTSDNNYFYNFSAYHTGGITTLLSLDYVGEFSLNDTAIPATMPIGRVSLGDKVLDIRDTGTNPTVNLVVHYTGAEVSVDNIIENTLDIWRYDAGAWDAAEVAGSAVNIVGNNVSATLTAFSTFAPLGELVTEEIECVEDSDCAAGQQCVDGECLNYVVQEKTDLGFAKIEYTCTSAGHMCCDRCDTALGNSYKNYHASCEGESVCCDVCNTTVYEEAPWWETYGEEGGAGLTGAMAKGFISPVVNLFKNPMVATIWVAAVVLGLTVFWVLHKKSVLSKAGESYFDKINE